MVSNVMWAGDNPAWTFVLMAHSAGMSRAMLTTIWFMLGERWYHA